MTIIVSKTVRELAKAEGRRVSPGYIDWLNRYVTRLVKTHCHKLRGMKTLHVADAAALHGEA